MASGGLVHANPKEYRKDAEECLEIASKAEEVYVKTALMELAADFNEMAEKLVASVAKSERDP